MKCSLFPGLAIIRKWDRDESFEERILSSDADHPCIRGVYLCTWNRDQQPVSFLVPFGSTGRQQKLLWCGIITELPVWDIASGMSNRVLVFVEQKLRWRETSQGKLKDRASATITSGDDPVDAVQVHVCIKRVPFSQHVFQKCALQISVLEPKKSVDQWLSDFTFHDQNGVGAV